MPDRVARAIGRFWDLLDSETVRLFVWPFYIALFGAGVYLTFCAQTISIVEPVMGHVFYNLWVWLHIPGTLFVLVGLVMRHGGKPLHEMGAVLLFTDYLGLWMQTAGHCCMGLLLAAYEISVVKGGFWGQPLYSLFALAPYVLGCVFLALQTGRKIRHGILLAQHPMNHPGQP